MKKVLGCFSQKSSHGTTASIDGIYTASSISTPSGPRKAGAINGKDDGDLPVGDGTWILMLLAAGYALFIAQKRSCRF